MTTDTRRRACSGRRTPRSPRSPASREWATAPSVVAVTLVAGTGMVAVVATSLGLLPLYGPPDLTGAGWASARGDLLLGIRETLLIVLPATVLAGLAGLVLAGAVLASGRSGVWVRLTCLAVLAVPHLVGATSVGMLLADGGVAARLAGGADAGWPPLVGGPWPVATVLELAWKESAFVALVVVASVGPGHRHRSEVAAVLGAGALRRWTRVLVPTAAPALGAAALVVLVYSVGNYEVAWLLGRAYPEPLPVLSFRLFGSIELADRRAAAAAAALAAGLALALVLPLLAALPRLRQALTSAAAPEGYR